MQNQRKSSIDSRRPSEQGSVFGGPLSVKSGINSAMQQEILLKKLKKRL